MDRKAVNAHYGKINERFDGRADQLRKLGFTYEHVAIDKATLGVFVQRSAYRRIPTLVSASEVMHADEICWAERLNDVSR